MKKNKGFPLIELLIVVAVIGLIVFFVLPAIRHSRLQEAQRIKSQAAVEAARNTENAADLESQRSVLSSPMMQVEGVVADNPVRISPTNSLYHINLQWQWTGSPDQYTKAGQTVNPGKRMPVTAVTGTFRSGQRVRCTQARTRSQDSNTWGPYDSIFCDPVEQ